MFSTKKILAFSLALLGCFSAVFAQGAEDPTLFSLSGRDVKLSEFRYIYEKNMGAKADYSDKSLKEYMELYINFKLRVQKARDMKLDQEKSYTAELDGYRRQLSSSYLMDKEVSDKLVREAYERSKKDVRIAHILISCPENADQTTDAAARDRATKVLSETNAANFAEKAKQYSDDPAGKTDGGEVGWFAVLQLPHTLEDAIYKVKEGQVAGPVRTAYGYHIVMVRETRPARGQVQAAHILVRTDADSKEKTEAAGKLIQDIYTQLQGGTSWDTLVVRHTQDNGTRMKGGNLGWFGINKFDQAFEDKAFGLKKDGEYTAPFKTDAGWHIMKRIKAMATPTFEEARGEISQKVKKDSRFSIAQKALVERIKTESKFALNQEGVDAFMGILDTEFNSFRWKEPDSLMKAKGIDTKELIKLGERKVTVGEFSKFCVKETMLRANTQSQNGISSVQLALDKLLDKFTQEVCMQYEERNLETKYPEFRSLMREYEEGILRFEVTKKEIWDKASADEAGLNSFYNTNKNKYKWADRAMVTSYAVNSTDEKLLAEIAKFAKKKSPEAVMAKFNAEEKVVTFEQGKYEMGKNKEVDALGFKKGNVGPFRKDLGKTYFKKVEQIMKPSVKSLVEAKGYVVADYQDYLEQEWVKRLRTEYPVKIDNAVLAKIKK